MLFDFDLSEAEKYHRSMGADVTVIITHCDGVTGEKLVFTSPSGRITGFSGSVGRCGFLTDKADTGIYIISGRILKMLRDRTITVFQMRYCLNCSHKIKVFLHFGAPVTGAV